MPDWVTLLKDSPLAGVLLGGLGGALVATLANIAYQRRRRRTEVTLNLIERFFEVYSDLAQVKSLLQNPPSLQNRDNLNRVLKMGDWYEMVAALCVSNIADRGLLKGLGLDKQMAWFYRSTLAIRQNLDLEPAVKSWEQLEKFSKEV